MSPLDQGRLRRLSEKLLSPQVQVPEPAYSDEVLAKLNAEEVEQTIVDHVPGVRKFLFRDQPGQLSLRFMVSAYQEGWRAFKDTELHNHLLWLMRRIIHHGHEGGADAARHLGDVAEAFRDCQAVQARVVERVGLQLVGVANDFRGQAVRLAGEYKTLALQMLAQDRLAKGMAMDYDDVPTHYENRLTADIGPFIGANADDIRRAELDQHAAARFSPVSGKSAQRAVARCRELFDAEAMLTAFVAEVNSFSEESPQDSLSRTFLDWASENLAQKHMVLDEDTCSRAEIDPPLALCVFEALFLGGPAPPPTEMYRGISMREIFGGPLGTQRAEEAARPSAQPSSAAAGGVEPPAAPAGPTPRRRRPARGTPPRGGARRGGDAQDIGLDAAMGAGAAAAPPAPAPRRRPAAAPRGGALAGPTAASQRPAAREEGGAPPAERLRVQGRSMPSSSPRQATDTPSTVGRKRLRS